MVDIFKNELYTITKAVQTDTGYMYTCKTADNKTSFWIIYGPTCNCQVSSIACCDNIINRPDFRDIIYSLYKHGHICKQLLVDVTDRESYNKVLSAFEVVFSNKYESTNYSDMIMYLLRIGEKQELDEDYDNDYGDDD